MSLEQRLTASLIRTKQLRNEVLWGPLTPPHLLSAVWLMPRTGMRT